MNRSHSAFACAIAFLALTLAACAAEGSPVPEGDTASVGLQLMSGNYRNPPRCGRGEAPGPPRSRAGSWRFSGETCFLS